VQNLKRAVETPREGCGLDAASGNFPDAAASEPAGRAPRLTAAPIPGFRATIVASGSHGLPLRDTLWGEFPSAAFSSAGMAGVFRLRAHPHRRLQISSRRSAQHDSKERVWQVPENPFAKAKNLRHSGTAVLGLCWWSLVELSVEEQVTEEGTRL